MSWKQLEGDLLFACGYETRGICNTSYLEQSVSCWYDGLMISVKYDDYNNLLIIKGMCVEHPGRGRARELMENWKIFCDIYKCRIFLFAMRSEDKNGYMVFPKLGFDGPLLDVEEYPDPESQYQELIRLFSLNFELDPEWDFPMIREFVKKGKLTVQALIAEMGPAFWQMYGYSVVLDYAP